MELLHKISRTGGYCLYSLLENHRHGHGIHSPFMFRFVTEVMDGKSVSEKSSWIETFRKESCRNREIIRGRDAGAGSRFSSRADRPFSHWAKHSSVNPCFGNFLYRLAADQQPELIIELGTAIGIGTMYLASAKPDIPVHTVEAHEGLASAAVKNFTACGLKNIKLFGMTFDEYFDQLSLKNHKRLLVWIDGDHRGENLLRNVERLMRIAAEGSIFILDDIRWSASMEKAWKTIRLDPRIRVTADCWNQGMCFINNNLQKQNYWLKF